jgi:uncharacterized membrane protein (UPF0182 family)
VRDVKKRVELVAPFLDFDSDPYVVDLDGDLKYVVDGYTTTSRYPYAQRAETDDQRDGSGLDHNFNYVRNSVKAVVDAYDGTVTLYVVDDTDPLIKAYREAFPHLFTDADKVPDDLRAHFRYPEDLFRVQTSMWGRYHIKDPDDFYNRADAWDVAQEPGAVAGSATTATSVGPTAVSSTGRRMEPYYLQMRLPGEESEEFLILRPFVPVSRNNERQELTAFMVAKSDPTDYGQLETFVMPRGNLPDGPGIVAATMSSDPAVSELETLLGQQGSDLIFGNLIIVPIEQSLLYVRPVYVESESTRIPELERVIVSYEGRVVLRNTLQQALTDLFGDAPDTLEEPSDGTGSGSEPDALTVDELLANAVDAFDEAQRALADGDLGTYQEKVNEARRFIEQAQTASGGGTSTSSTTTTTTAPD